MVPAENSHRISRRSLGLGGSAVLVAGAASGVPSPNAFAAGANRAGSPVLETVRGPVRGDDVRRALAHEHFFVDFLGPTADEYMNVDWTDATGAAVNAARELRAQRVNLVIDWTCLGVGRNVSYLRDVSRQTGVHIVAATGIYKSLVPPALERASIDDMAAHFATELTRGIDGTNIRAGFIKCATTESGPTASDTRVHRAAARAARSTGATIALHCPHAEAANTVADTLEGEGFDLRRLLWGHAQVSSSAAHLAMTKRGASVQFDAIGAESDPFFEGPTDDASMLDRIQAMVEAGFGHRVTVSNDASVVVHPPIYQYDRDPLYLYRTFYRKLVNRLGHEQARQVTRDNVVRIFRRGARVG